MRLIDADALIAEYDRVHIGKPGGARKLMVDAPTVEERKWIPCSERLPEVTERYTDAEAVAYCGNGNYEPVGVFICFESEDVLTVGYYEGKMVVSTATYCEWRYEDKTETAWRDNLTGDCDIDSVIAWMPLPEPYKGGNDES